MITMGTDGTPGSCGKKALNCQILVGYLQFVERKHLHTALCSSTVAWKPESWLSVSGTTAPLKNCSMKQTESPQQMAAMYNLRGEYVELAVVQCSA